jgi:hypothetical protein
MMEGISSSETSALTRTTRRNTPEDAILLYQILIISKNKTSAAVCNVLLILKPNCHDICSRFRFPMDLVLLGVLQAVMNRATFEKQFHKISDGVNFL